MLAKEKRVIVLIFTILLITNIFAWLAVYNLSQPRFLEVIFFNVGQGDSIFIETSQGHQILIDGGPDSTVLEKLREEIPFYDRTIDLMILTHPEADHMAGLVEVLKSYKVENILWTGVENETELFKKWQETIKEEGAKIIIAKAGQKIFSHAAARSAGAGENSQNEIYFRIINPLENLEGQKPKNTNNTSIVAQLVFGQNEFLFTGDIYEDKERGLAEKYNLDSDILKVSHHGSKTSSSKEFLQEVGSEIAVISCGKDNSYGHPHPGVLEKLEGIRVLRTDIDGDIKFKCDTERCLVSTDY